MKQKPETSETVEKPLSAAQLRARAFAKRRWELYWLFNHIRASQMAADRVLDQGLASRRLVDEWLHLAQCQVVTVIDELKTAQANGEEPCPR